ncbi:hypothetical protein C6W23_05430 [Bacillus atrophaeus]|nr:hypothetical protein C6W23_05430 [Bacillus atrophaeus]
MHAWSKNTRVSESGGKTSYREPLLKDFACRRLKQCVSARADIQERFYRFRIAWCSSKQEGKYDKKRPKICKGSSRKAHKQH